MSKIVPVVALLGAVAFPFYQFWRATRTGYVMTNRRAMVWECGIFGGAKLVNYLPLQLTNLRPPQGVDLQKCRGPDLSNSDHRHHHNLQQCPNGYGNTGPWRDQRPAHSLWLHGHPRHAPRGTAAPRDADRSVDRQDEFVSHLQPADLSIPVREFRRESINRNQRSENHPSSHRPPFNDKIRITGKIGLMHVILTADKPELDDPSRSGPGHSQRR